MSKNKVTKKPAEMETYRLEVPWRVADAYFACAGSVEGDVGDDG